MIADLVRRTRTVRRFQEERALEPALLRDLVELSRLGGSARNGQVLKYMVITDQALRQALFPLLGWAGYLPDWPGPAAGERPAAYVVCLLDKELLKGAESEAHCDLGIATQNLLLGAAEQGVFGCRIGAFAPAVMHRLLQLEERFKVLLVVALGYPAESVVLEELGPDGDIRYWHDAQGVHHVPKRSFEDIILEPSVGL
ncbi:MAG: nitroreductase family protein [Desulfobulbaceae bacterium]|nr:nitroreductase family protein [Desulfobulbaceae bacterium]